MATVTTTKRHVLYDVEIREGKRLVRIIGEGLRRRRAVWMRDLFNLSNELAEDESAPRAVTKKRQRGMGHSRFQVLCIECPKGWKPTCWTDLPPLPYRAVEVLKKSCTRAEAEGYCFGFNTASQDDRGFRFPTTWAVTVRIHVMTPNMAEKDGASRKAGVA